ncbi:RagB/SusD family nutrient uptake outer membrane protein [Fodinibius sp. AD559]|uniref:RagB/SusD family nutrient uptake outer membrane protein n=1 Tax=Fodinibius sp. AD559 TaxID=3424179 RepID=UPI004046FA58
MKNITKYLLVLLVVAGVSSGCEDFVSPSVDQNKPTETVIQSVGDLQAVVNGGYDYLNDVDLYGRDFYVAGDVMSDNAFSNGNSGRFVNHDQMIFTVNSGYASGAWQHFYQVIGTANLALGAELEGDGVEAIKGEAYALRAFSHMNLLLAFGQQYVSGGDASDGVPYVTTYADSDEFAPSRDAIADVWANIEADLNSAAQRLDPGSFNATSLNYWAVRALQTRFYLYTEQYDQVIPIAEEIINSGNFSVTPTGELVETWASGEGPASLFEVAFIDTDALGTDNIARIYRPTNYGDVEVSEDLYNAHASDDVRLDLYGEPGDEVQTLLGPVTIDGYRMLGKYTDETGAENVRVIRYAEVILNYAEAIAEGGSGATLANNTTEALNMLAEHRYNGGSPYSVATNPADIDDVLAERRLELAMEGHRLYDLIRTGRDIPLGDSESYRASTGGTLNYGTYRAALPIPDSEIRANSNISQNEGY